MGDKKESIYSSSQEAFWKIMVLVFSFGISIVASLLDDKSCYIAILVQAVNNIYDLIHGQRSNILRLPYKQSIEPHNIELKYKKGCVCNPYLDSFLYTF